MSDDPRPSILMTKRALFTQRRKDAYEALHPETRVGHAGAAARWDASAKLAPAFTADTADTAKKTGQSERAVQRDASRGERVSAEVLSQIAEWVSLTGEEVAQVAPVSRKGG